MDRFITVPDFDLLPNSVTQSNISVGLSLISDIGRWCHVYWKEQLPRRFEPWSAEFMRWSVNRLSFSMLVAYVNKSICRLPKIDTSSDVYRSVLDPYAIQTIIEKLPSKRCEKEYNLEYLLWCSDMSEFELARISKYLEDFYA